MYIVSSLFSIWFSARVVKAITYHANHVRDDFKINDDHAGREWVLRRLMESKAKWKYNGQTDCFLVGTVCYKSHGQA